MGIKKAAGSHCLVRTAQKKDYEAILEIFNYYIRSSFAAYPVEEVDLRFLDAIRRVAVTFPLYIVEGNERVVGFGMMRPFLPYQSFRHTAQLSYFLRPEWTGQGLGSLLLDRLTADARERGIRVLLANVSSRNESSLQFHLKHGFEECGRLREVGEKFGSPFDVVWLQKILGPPS